MTVEVSPITGGVVRSLTDAASIVWDASQGFTYAVTIAGNRTLAKPTGLVEGATYVLLVTQGSGGSHLLEYAEDGFLFAAAEFPTLATAAGAITSMTFVAVGGLLELTASTINLKQRPTKPSGLVATGGVGQVSLAWTDNSSIEDAYVVERLDGPEFTVISADLAAGTQAYVDDDLDPGSYTYRIVAKRDGERSTPSNESTASAS